MGTIQDKLEYLNDTKELIKAAIEAKGISVPENTPFRGYANLVGEIVGGDFGGYVVGEPAELSIPLSSWDGTTSEPIVYGYKEGPSSVQLGLMPGSSTPVTQEVIASALTITRVSTAAPDLEKNTVGRVNFRIVAVNVPTRDIKVAIFGLVELTGSELVMITQTAITGVTPPVTGETPVKSIDNTQFTGTITWNPDNATFAASTAYTATITLTPKAGYKLAGVAANSFTVEGATSVTHNASSGVITAVFPATAAAETVSEEATT